MKHHNKKRVADKNIPQAWRSGVLEFMRQEGRVAFGCGILCPDAGGTIIECLIDPREMKALGEPLPSVGQQAYIPGPNRGGELWVFFCDRNPADSTMYEVSRARVLGGGVYVKWDSGVW